MASQISRPFKLSQIPMSSTRRDRESRGPSLEREPYLKEPTASFARSKMITTHHVPSGVISVEITRDAIATTYREEVTAIKAREREYRALNEAIESLARRTKGLENHIQASKRVHDERLFS